MTAAESVANRRAIKSVGKQSSVYKSVYFVSPKLFDKSLTFMHRHTSVNYTEIISCFFKNRYNFFSHSNSVCKSESWTTFTVLFIRSNQISPNSVLVEDFSHLFIGKFFTCRSRFNFCNSFNRTCIVAELSQIAFLNKRRNCFLLNKFIKTAKFMN